MSSAVDHPLDANGRTPPCLNSNTSRVLGSLRMDTEQVRASADCSFWSFVIIPRAKMVLPGSLISSFFFCSTNLNAFFPRTLHVFSIFVQCATPPTRNAVSLTLSSHRHAHTRRCSGPSASATERNCRSTTCSSSDSTMTSAALRTSTSTALGESPQIMLFLFFLLNHESTGVLYCTRVLCTVLRGKITVFMD